MGEKFDFTNRRAKENDLLVGDYVGANYSDYIKFLFENKYIAEDGAPLKCQFCDANNMKSHKYEDSDYGFVQEVEVYCGDCHRQLGHWRYGVWTI